MRRSSLGKLAELAITEQPVGSSAGGERPKFSAFVEGRHKLVKFAGHLRNPAQRRWRDLLWCEALAVRVFAQGGVPAVSARFTEGGDHG